MNWSAAGMSSLVLEIVKHRKTFEDALPLMYSTVIREVKDALGDAEYEERILGNYAVLLITYKILEDRITFPFTYESIFTQCVEGIIENSESIQDSNGLTEFWNILQWMFEHKIIFADIQFKIETSIDVKTIGLNKKKEVWQNVNRDEIIYIRLNSLHQDYLKEVTKRQDAQPIGETTLRNYFKSRTYFLGLVKGKRFENGVSSCYAFNYTQMKANNILMVDPLKVYKEGETTEASEEDKDDLPF